MENNELRLSNNFVRITGQLAEKNLKNELVDTEIETKNGTQKVKMPRITGDIKIKVDETTTISIPVMQNKYKKKGGMVEENKNSLYTGLETILAEYVSIAESSPEKPADTISINRGQLNLYEGRDGRPVFSCRSSFFTRNVNDPENRAVFGIELVLDSIKPEMDKGNRTGRKILTGWTVVEDFRVGNVLEQVEIKVPAEYYDAITPYESLKGATIYVEGNIICGAAVVTQVPARLGPARTITTPGKSELVLLNLSTPYGAQSLPGEFVPVLVDKKTEKVDPSMAGKYAYDADLIAKAIEERRARYEERRARQQAGNNRTTNSNITAGRTINLAQFANSGESVATPKPSQPAFMSMLDC